MDRESSPEEIQAVKDAFSKNYSPKINDTYCRCSEGHLPMQLFISVIGGLIGSGLIEAIKAFLKDKRCHRNPCVTLRKTDKFISFSRDKVTIMSHEEFKQFNSIEEFEKHSGEIEGN